MILRSQIIRIVCIELCNKSLFSNLSMYHTTQINKIDKTYAVGLKFFAIRSLYIKPTDPPAMKPKVIASIKII